MTPFTVHTGPVASIARADVDTDQIVPKQFLKRIERTGFGTCLFHDWRYLEDGSPNPGFELNDLRAAGASILLAGRNFGCGSSREHAPWALADYGIRTIIGTTFADIFYANCLQNGLLPVRLTSTEMTELFRRAADSPGAYLLTVDLVRGLVSDAAGFSAGFSIDAWRRELLLKGLDEIGLTLLEAPRISAFERRRAALLAGTVAS